MMLLEFMVFLILLIIIGTINCNDDDLLSLNPRDVVRYRMKIDNDDTMMINNDVNISAVASDNFLLCTNKSSLPKFNGLGVFAKRLILKDSIICEYKGKIVDQLNKPFKEHFKRIKIGDSFKYILGYGVCSFVQDCSNAYSLLMTNITLMEDENDQSNCYDGFSYNARALIIGSKIFIVSNRNILPNEEIFYSYSWDYWKYWTLQYQVSLSISLKLKEVKRNYNFDIEEDIHQHSQNSTIDAIDSDYWLLYIDKSTIPVDGAGNGVFARKPIPQHSILCEYRGPILDNKAADLLPYNDKYFGIKHIGKSILGKGLCSMINDCSNAIVLLNSNSTLLNEENDPSRCYDGLQINARAIFLADKLFIVSARHIFEGEEIFYTYGWSYWKSNYRFQQTLKNLQPIHVNRK